MDSKIVRWNPMNDSSMTIVTVRDFLRTFSKLTQTKTKKQFLIMRHGKPLGVFTPYNTVTKIKTGKPGSAIDGLIKLRFRSGEGDLSQRIDEIVYGIGTNKVSH